MAFKCCVDGCSRDGIYVNKKNRHIAVCGQHKQPNMISMYCDLDCSYKAIYGYQNQPATRCSLHKNNGMVLIEQGKSRKLCIKCNLKYPSFNYKDQYIPLYCRQCAEPLMVNVSKLKGRECQRCNEFVSNSKYFFCDSCIKSILIDTEHEYHCETCKTKIAEFGYKNKTIPIRCEKCCVDGMILIRERKRKRVDDDLVASKRSKVVGNSDAEFYIREDKGDILLLKSGIQIAVSLDGTAVYIAKGLKLVAQILSDGSIQPYQDALTFGVRPMIQAPSVISTQTAVNIDDH